MATSDFSSPEIVSREEWLAARKAFLLNEKAVTYELDRPLAERRLGATDWLSLAATPSFAIMALLTAVLGGVPMLCAARQNALSGMLPMTC